LGDIVIVDTLTVLHLLRERGIRVVRSRYVTNAKQAVAFAARGPIALRLVPTLYDSGSSLALTDLSTSTMVRHAYDFIAAQAEKFAGGQILAQRMLEPGTDIGIRCRADAALGRIVEVRSGAHRVRGLAPIDLHQAQTVLADVFEKAHVAFEPGTMRTLGVLMVRACTIFTNTVSSRLTLDPVRLHDDSYDVLDAMLEMRRANGSHRHPARRRSA
jgi:hypothetical protein